MSYSILERALLGLPLAAFVLTASPAAAQTGTPHECTFCHVVHAAPGPNLGVLADVETICLTCHGPAGTSSLKATVHTNDSASFSITCIECHTPHASEPNEQGGTNVKQVGRILDADPWAKIFTPNSGLRSVIFESSGTDATPAGPSLYSFADDDQDGNGIWDGVCEVCHTTTSHHTNFEADPAPKHHVGKDCTACHAHDDRFMPSGGSCQDCHSGPQDNGDGVPLNGRRPIVAEFTFSSHHVQGTLEDADCEVCHDQSEHQSGLVRLKDADDPQTITVLNGDPATDSSVASGLEGFCLSCHDSDGAGGNAPFSDGFMPPVVDASAWNNSSHRGPLSCYGDGDFGCHSSGHGSNKKTMLAPWSIAPTAPANAEEEEGFCLNCHDSDGPASSDLKSGYDAPINWVQQATGLNTNPDLNDRHDVQYEAQQRSGAKIECIDCHNPHVANNGLPFILDPDPTDGHVVGTDYYFYSATTDLWSEFCLDCHDGSFPAGVQGHSGVSLVNIQGTWGADGMGGRDSSGGANLQDTTQWFTAAESGTNQTMECWRCHRPHPVYDADVGSTNHFGAVDMVMDLDGTTPLDGYYVRQGGQWLKTFEYGLSSNASGADPVVDGGAWCNTCHGRTSMVGKDDCYACHRHGDGSRF